jgi:hypothetical protein
MKTLLLLRGAAMLALGVAAAAPAAEAGYYGNVPHRGYYGNVPQRGAYHHYQPHYNYRPPVYWLGYYLYPYSYGYTGPRRGFQERR